MHHEKKTFQISRIRLQVIGIHVSSTPSRKRVPVLLGLRDKFDPFLESQSHEVNHTKQELRGTFEDDVSLISSAAP